MPYKAINRIFTSFYIYGIMTGSGIDTDPVVWQTAPSLYPSILPATSLSLAVF